MYTSHIAALSENPTVKTVGKAKLKVTIDIESMGSIVWLSIIHVPSYSLSHSFKNNAIT